MKRIVITGCGIVSSLGNNREEVRESLRAGRSGIVASPKYAELGMRCRVHGAINIDTAERIERKLLRFMGDAAAYSYIAIGEAIEQSGLPPQTVSSERTGLLLGTGGASPGNIVLAADTLRERGIRRVGPYMVTKAMASTITACVGTALKIKGISYSISSACATSAHCIGHAAELIQLGKQDVVFAGGGEELHWTLSLLFDGMGAMSSKFNDTPQAASRPYDRDRDGFVISGGAGVVVMESLEHAEKRGANILAELVGYGATSDGFDMVQPSGEGAVRCMRQALQQMRDGGHDAPVQYINAHGTSTPVGDVRELEAIAEVFGGGQSQPQPQPWISATKSLSGHALGAAGANEAIYTLLMMESGFIAGSANIENLDPAAAGFSIATERRDADLDVAMSNSFGFGGVNSSLIFKRWRG
ncbi:MAG: beta-ketoacyl-ACP synthase I [Gammaproteobacteria bacterium]|nr:beta-ketoacyl-ACP synthase I [Gammaproteobacteria bacterium]CAJ2376035.1 MAG: beta-ketoacyl-(acyl carrier protein) synthase I [Arenicellales bacterium IbO2]MDA7970391.1 beta-ketoacyl-ACP synthase I [Gammaproteobacteria bacterium]MDA7971232.1 beta-ketoacyl-ACP synthase I [Gammaproteobacteria bacterium]MDA7995754.1 beta-ketoacyl-ACP synthase I [Gammaproteobacteria bacterium]